MDIVSYGGWDRCARFTIGKTELFVTLDVGPRIIRLAAKDGPNELKEYADQMGRTGGEKYRSYGGHRLWIGPEDEIRTMQPDNGAVEHGSGGQWEAFRSKPDKFLMQKEIAIALDKKRKAFRIRHRIYNRGAYDVKLAPWSITVMDEGGECLVPHASFQPHPQRLLPVRPLVLWSYTRLDDPRYTLGPGLIRLRHDPKGSNQKIGMPVAQGYAAYANHGNLFLKRFDFQDNVEYPDMGCNFETFTRQDMLEIESLGPMQTVAGGSCAEHFETWYLIENSTPPQDTAEATKWLDIIAKDRPHLPGD
jgi:hypothetical protein